MADIQVLSVEMLDGFFSGISADEQAAQAVLVNATKARLPGLYEVFKVTSEVDFKLVTKQWKDKHKGDRAAAVRISEASALFYAQRRVNAEFPDAGYHNAIKLAREALQKGGYRANGEKELDEKEKEFNRIKNAKAKARRELEQELGDKFYSMDDIELAKLLKVRVNTILNPETVALEDKAKAEVIEHGKEYALRHLEALALALGVEVKHEAGILSFSVDESIVEEDIPDIDKAAEKKAA